MEQLGSFNTVYRPVSQVSLYVGWAERRELLVRLRDFSRVAPQAGTEQLGECDTVALHPCLRASLHPSPSE
jgi:hypothetical protein